MSLSTFSGHIKNLVAILGEAWATSRSCSSTRWRRNRPRRGRGSRERLARLAGQARLTVATSHYAELKEWASSTAGVANAATGFDPETEEPLYRVALGRAGTSRAPDRRAGSVCRPSSWPRRALR